MMVQSIFYKAYLINILINTITSSLVSISPSLTHFTHCYLDTATIANQQQVKRFFHLDSGMRLHLSSIFPPSMKNQVVTMEMICSPPLGSLKFQFLISDQVSHAHKFHKRSIRKERVVEVSENMSGVLFSMAEEKQVIERYRFLEPIPEMLELDEMQGLVAVKDGHMLDYEVSPEVRFAVGVNKVDDTSYFATQSVVLRLLDENDERPQFLNMPRPFLTVVSANALPGTSVFQLVARDADVQSEVNYFMESGEDRFEIDQQSGIVRTRGGEPFPLGKEFELGIYAEDVAAGFPQRTPTESLKVLVGMREPQFHQNFYEAFVPESSEERHEIIVVTAISHSGNPITYELTQNGDQSIDFAIDQNSGTVDLLRRLDYDNDPHKYLLIVKAIDHSRPVLTATVELMVHLMDVNDNPPTFPLSQYVVQDIREDVSIGTEIMTVAASDLDSGENSRLSYMLEDETFTLEHINNSAVIRTAKELDYDYTVGHTYSFIVTAYDHGSPRLSGSANIRVSVINVNDLQPTFSHNVEFVQVSEDASIGAFIHVLQAFDADGDMVTYGFSDGSTTHGPFSISPDSGIITMTQLPDKRFTSYRLNVSVYDDGSCCGRERTLSSMGLVIIEVKDINNNAPKFTECSNYNPSVMERENIGTFVIQVSATDLDTGINSNLTYSLVRFGEQSSFDRFEIDPKTGVIVTADVLDRESKVGVTDYGLTVKAEDHGSPSLAGFCSFRVKVGDKNDNPPIFSMLEYWVSVEESSPVGKKLKQVYATDRDAGVNSMVEYFIKRDSSGSGLFYLHPATGWLEVVGSLFGVILDIVARDMGDPPKSSEAKIVVEILAKAVDMPQWLEDYTKTSIAVDENVPVNHPVYRFKAVSSLNASGTADLLLNYFIAPGENPEQNGPPITFYHRHDESTNEMILLTYRTLDYETIPKYTLTIKAASRAMHSRHVDVQIILEVKDSNDEIPQFVGLDENGRYSGSVAENLKSGVEVICVTATDRDEFVDFRKISYEIKPIGEDHTKFNINSTSGIITTLQSFDREVKGEYYLTLIAKDGAPSSRSNHYPPGTPNQGETELQIRILDVNDNAPYFYQLEYKARIPENADVGTVVIIVTAEDNDEENVLTYSITSGNHGMVFEVVPETGEVKVRGHLDYETGPKEYKLTYRVFDEKLANTTTIRIEVIDINDNAPVFEQQVYVVEDEPEEDHTITRKNPKLLITVKARDVDSSDGSTDSHIRYGLTGQFTEDDTFTINEITGQIFLTTPLNRDLPQGRPVWNFNVLAYDESLTGYAEVKVYLSDVNDNPPVFDRSRLIGKVPEHSLPGHRIMTVMTSDNDSGMNASVSYSLKDVPKLINVPIFSINPQTGLIITMVEDLDREKVSEYQVVVVASDKGVPPLSSSATVTITVEDINDHVPFFNKKFYHVEIQENLPIGSSIVSLSALDLDVGVNGRLFYSLEMPEDRHYFTVASVEATNSGVVRIHKEIDFEALQEKYFNLTIRVEDIDSSHFDHAYVHVTIEDANDNPPVITPIHHKVEVYENVSIETQLFKFTAVDPDTGMGGMFRFYIDKTSDPNLNFKITQDGVVSTSQLLDREMLAEHKINVMCTDGGQPRLTSYATLIVTLTDINDNHPGFNSSLVPIIYENLPPGNLVAEIFPDDKDGPHNGPPFKIWLPCFGECPCPENPSCDLFEFRFIPDGGSNKYGSALITSSKSLNREINKYHLLPIILSDSGTPAMIGTSTLTIIVGDVNDNLHRPGHKDIFALITSGQNEDISMGTVYAEDPDDWDFKDKTFTLLEEEENGDLFRLNSSTGEIYPRSKLKSGSYRLNVKVYDMQWKHDVISSVHIHVTFVSESMLRNHGSVRLYGTNAIDFISKDQSINNGRSTMDKFCKIISNLLGVHVEEVLVLSVWNGDGERFVDVVYALRGGYKTSMEKMNGIVGINKREIETFLGLKISLAPIDKCQFDKYCIGSGCHVVLKVGGATNLIDANSTSFVGVGVQLESRCGCSSLPSQLQQVKSCHKMCLNGGRCVQGSGMTSCFCPDGFDGPRCQLTIKSFSGDGWAWLKPLPMCYKYHISVEILANQEEGIIYYQGPMTFDIGESEFPVNSIMLRLDKGMPLVEVTMGNDDYVVKLGEDDDDNGGGGLVDGKWHRIDLFISAEFVQLVLDKCSLINSQILTQIPPCESKLHLDYYKITTGNLNFGMNPLQVGGIYNSVISTYKGFNGCIRNLYFNDELYDLYVNPDIGMQYNTKDVCTDGHDNDDVCKVGNSRVCSKNSCGINFDGELQCQCSPGSEGKDCGLATPALDFGNNSFIEWDLTEEFHAFLTSKNYISIQLMFRTRHPSGMLFRVNNLHKSKFISVELANHRLVAIFNLNGWKKKLYLPHVNVSDGNWHSVTLTQERSWLEVKLDWGEGVYINRSLLLESKVTPFVIGRTGLVAGGNVKKLSFMVKPLVESDFKNGCLKDIRINDHHLPLAHWMTSKAATITTRDQQVSDGCHDYDACTLVRCSPPLDCVNSWRHAECDCLQGQMTTDGKGCNVIDSKCVDGDYELCDPECRDDDDDACGCDVTEICRSVTEELAVTRTTKMLLFVFLSIVFFIVLALVMLLTFHKKSKQTKKHPSDDINSYEARENIVHYDEEGVGERDESNYDVRELSKSYLSNKKRLTALERTIPPERITFYESSQLVINRPAHHTLGDYLARRLHKIDNDPNSPPFESVREYCYEGQGSQTGSFSSLGSFGSGRGHVQ